MDSFQNQWRSSARRIRPKIFSDNFRNNSQKMESLLSEFEAQLNFHSSETRFKCSITDVDVSCLQRHTIFYVDLLIALFHHQIVQQNKTVELTDLLAF